MNNPQSFLLNGPTAVVSSAALDRGQYWAEGPIDITPAAAAELARRKMRVQSAADVAFRLASPEAIAAFVEKDKRVTVMDAALCNPNISPSLMGDLLRAWVERGTSPSKETRRGLERFSLVAGKDDIHGLEHVLVYIPPAVWADNLRNGVKGWDAFRVTPDGLGRARPPELHHRGMSAADAELVLREFTDEGELPAIVGGEDDPEWVAVIHAAVARALTQNLYGVDTRLPSWLDRARLAGAGRIPIDAKNIAGDNLDRWSRLQPFNAEDLRPFGVDGDRHLPLGTHVEATREVLEESRSHRSMSVASWQFHPAPGRDAQQEALSWLKDNIEAPPQEMISRLFRLATVSAGPREAPLSEEFAEQVGIATTNLLRGGSAVLHAQAGVADCSPLVKAAISEAQNAFLQEASLGQLAKLRPLGDLAADPTSLRILAARLQGWGPSPEAEAVAVAALAGIRDSGQGMIRSPLPTREFLHILILAGPQVVGLGGMRPATVTTQPSGFVYVSADTLMGLYPTAMSEEVLPHWFTDYPDQAPALVRHLAGIPGALTEPIRSGLVRGPALGSILRFNPRSAASKDLAALVEEQLGDDPEAWKLLVTLLGDWEGTLQEALDTVATLRAT